MIPEKRQGERIRRCVRRGFTLIEMVVAVAVMSVIMLGVGSAMIIAGRAMPDAANPAAAAITAGRALQQIATELQYAVAVNENSATAIEFTVADRTNDDVPETIRYAWSGTPGDPLTRQYNAGAVVEMLGSVQDFALSYDLETISNEVTAVNESAETLLIEHRSTQNLADYTISSSASYGQYFLPSLPPDTVTWKVTRVQFFAKTHAPVKGESKVQLQLATVAHQPSGTVLEETTLLESTLTKDYLTQELSCSNAGELAPTQGLCLLVEWVADKDACNLQGQSAGITTADSHLLQSTDQGASWSSVANQSLLYQVFGTVTAPVTQIQNTYYLRLANIELKTTDDEQSIVHTSARTLNRPEVTP